MIRAHYIITEKMKAGKQLNNQEMTTEFHPNSLSYATKHYCCYQQSGFISYPYS